MSDRDLIKELQNEVIEYPESWQPEVGGIISGVLLKYTRGPTSYGEVDIAWIQQDGDQPTLCVWLTRQILRSKFREKRPRPGERIAIKYHGQPSGKSYHQASAAAELPVVLPRSTPLEEAEMLVSPKENVALDP